MKKLTMVQRKKLHRFVRAVIQLCFFIWFPSVFTTAFTGVKYIFTQLGNREIIELTAFVRTLVILCVCTVLFGRFFCGYACAFGSLGDAVRAAFVWISKKCKRKPFTLKESWQKYLRMLKYAVLLVIILLCYFGIYGKTTGSSVWDVFSRLRVGKFSLSGYEVGAILFLLVLIGMAVCERFFCRFLCPMGAVFSLLPIIPLFGIQRDRKQCLNGCSACKRSCPAKLDIADKGSFSNSPECIQCGSCLSVCPKQNVSRWLSGSNKYIEKKYQ